MRTQNNTRQHNSNNKSFKIRQNLTNSSLKSSCKLEHTLQQQCLQLQNPKTPDLHQSNEKNLASHCHCMMTKKLKLVARCPVNPRYCELVLLRETIIKQDEKITSLERKLGHLGSSIVVLESQFAFANHVADVLQEKLDDQEQYSHRPCLVIEGIRSWENETEGSLTNSTIDIIKSDLQLPNVTVNDVDKCHRIGPTDNDGKQNIIIKFAKHTLQQRSLEKDGS